MFVNRHRTGTSDDLGLPVRFGVRKPLAILDDMPVQRPEFARRMCCDSLRMPPAGNLKAGGDKLTTQHWVIQAR